MKIRLTQDAYIDGYNGAFLREYDKNGTALATGLWDSWYTATAKDDKGNAYIVFWAIVPEWNPEEDDESDACDWDNPYMILDGDGKNVTAKADIEW